VQQPLSTTWVSRVNWQHDGSYSTAAGSLLGYQRVSAVASGDVTQEMAISMSLTGATPGLLGASHSTPQHNWQQQQRDATPVQQHQHLDMESPELGVPVSAAAAAYAAPAEVQHGDPAGCDSDGMDIDADENAAPASPAAGPAGGSAAAGDVDGLTTNLLLDDNRQLMGWGHVPLAVNNTRPSLGGGGGLTTHTGRGSVGSNVLTMHSVGLLLVHKLAD